MKIQRVFLSMCVCGLLLSIVGCSKLTQSAATNSAANNASADGNKSASTDNAAVPGDARAEVLKAFQALLTVPAYKLQTVGTDPDGKNSTVTMDYVAPDRYEIKREGDAGTDSDSEKSDVVAIGNDTWYKRGDKPWEKSPVKMSMVKDMQKEWLDKINDKNSEVTSAGTETVDGATMNVYQISYSVKDEGAEETYKGTGKVWIGADHLVHRSEMESQSSDSPRSSKMTSTYSYGTDTKIEAPM